MNTVTKEYDKPTLDIIDKIFGKIIIYHGIKDLIKENIALNIITDLENFPFQNYIDNIISIKDKYSRSAMLDNEGVMIDVKDFIEDLKKESSLQDIGKKSFYEKLCVIFNFYFLGKHGLKYGRNENIDEDELPEFYPLPIKEFIKSSYITFQKICAMQKSSDFAYIIILKADKQMNYLTQANCALILTMTFLGKIRNGRKINSLLFSKIPKTASIPDSFKKLCRIKNCNYIIYNTDYTTLDFQLAVFDLMRFVDSSNKIMFNNKMNEYLKTINEKVMQNEIK